MGASEDQLLDAFAAAAQSWEKILFAPGGLLALHKCCWWLIAWDWCHNLPICRDPHADDHSVRLTNVIDTAEVPIQRLSMQETNVGLGFRLARMGAKAMKYNTGKH